MVIKLTGPKNMEWSSHYLESLLPNKYKLKQVSIKKYLSADQAAHYLRIPEDKVLDFAKKSTYLHAIEGKMGLLVHPDGVVEAVRRFMQKEIAGEMGRKAPQAGQASTFKY